MRKPSGYSAKQPLPANPVPLGGAVIPPKPQAWHVIDGAVQRTITLDGLGRWILAAEFNDGFRIEVNATDSVNAAAASATADAEFRIQELEEENNLVKNWLQRYFDLYGSLDGEGS